MSAFLRHGGALDAATARFGGRRGDWLDLSTGINPVPPPLPPIPAECWTRLPEAALEAEAIAAARRFFGAPGEAALVAAPGSGAVIALLPALVADAHGAAAIEPGYGEYRRALEAARVPVTGVEGPEAVPDGVRLAVIANPNNPDGRRFEPDRLLALADAMAARGGLLVVDEAFMDADPRGSVAGAAGRPGLLVLRSFGKGFGFAGARLGFALGTLKAAERLRERLGPWAVSGPALFLGARLMGDDALVREMRDGVARRAALTRAAIRAGGLEPQGDAALFALVETDDGAGAVFEALARRRVLVRPFAARPRWLRIGQVRDDREAERLGAALREALGR